MESLVTSIVNAMGDAVVGGGFVRFVHRLWWHLASILGWAWIASLAVGGTPLMIVARLFAYLGLPDALQEVPLHVRGWILERPELSAVATLILAVALLVDMRPWGDSWTDEPMSPAGATGMLSALYLLEVSGNGVLWPVVLSVGLLLIVKGIVQAPQAAIYALLSPFLTLLYTPLAVGAVLLSPARVGQAKPVVAQGATRSRP